MTKQQAPTLLERIQAHGRDLLAIFPEAIERDPQTLCRKLRRLEARAAALALRLCNGPEWDTPEDCEAAFAQVRAKVNELLNPQGDADRPTVFINRDPRGYALKISDETMRAKGYKLATDWGGYGLVAPDLRD